MTAKAVGADGLKLSYKLIPQSKEESVSEPNFTANFFHGYASYGQYFFTSTIFSFSKFKTQCLLDYPINDLPTYTPLSPSIKSPNTRIISPLRYSCKPQLAQQPHNFKK